MSKNIADLHPRLQAKIAELKSACQNRGITISIGECLRTVAEQDALYAQGRTTPPIGSGYTVTNAKGSSYSSQHQWGIAFDFYLNMDVDGDGDKGDDAFNDATGLFEKVGAIAKSLGLGWGGDWTSPKDRPHLYLPDWGSTPAQLKNMYGTLDKFRATWGSESIPVMANPVIKPASGSPVIRGGQIHCNNFTNAGLTPDGVDGPKSRIGAVKTLQTGINLDYKAGLTVDGVWGTKSEHALGSHTIRSGETQYLVTALEILLMLKGYDPGGVESPGKFGNGLEAALRSYQAKQSLTADGIAGMGTLKALIS